MTVRITASVTNEITAEYDVDNVDEALRRFLLINPDAEIKKIDAVCVEAPQVDSL